MLLLSGCAKVKIEDTEWCVDEGSLGADCFHTLLKTKRTLSKLQWDTERFGQVSTTLDGFTKIQSALEKLCSISSNKCSYQDQQNIQKMKEKILLIKAQLHLE